MARTPGCGFDFRFGHRGRYALIAIGYTLVYGILFMINFAHGEVMMLGVLRDILFWKLSQRFQCPQPRIPDLTFLNAQPIISWY